MSTRFIMGLVLGLTACRVGFDLQGRPGPADDPGGPLDGAEPPGALDAAVPLPKVECRPGQRAVLPGHFASLAESAGRAVVGYVQADQSMFVQGFDADGQLAGPPIRLIDGVASSASARNLRLTAGDDDQVTASLDVTVDGWSTVLTATITPQLTMPAPLQRLTSPGGHGREAVVLQRGPQFIAVFRLDIPDARQFFLVSQLFDAAWQGQPPDQQDANLGSPSLIVPVGRGYLIQTDRNLLSSDAQGALAIGQATSGFDQVALVEGRPHREALLVRSAGGIIQRVVLDVGGRETGHTDVITGMDTIRDLHARYAQASELATWQDHAQPYVARSVGLAPWTPVPVPISGAKLAPVSVVGGRAGPLVFVERDAAGLNDREVVVVQTCES